jgi:adenosine kinase
MVFPDRFKHHILPEQVHILNVCFQVPTMRREFGGCAGNIAYNMKLLGGDPLPMGTVGRDFGPYAAWMDRHGIERRHITEVEGTYTAQAYITTDMDDNQITAFHPGAMDHAHKNLVSDAAGVKLGIVSPDGRQAMIEHAAQFAGSGIPFVFDPGQGLPMFGREELEVFLDQASYLALNDYESLLLQEKTGRTLDSISGQLQALIVTRGAEGSDIHVNGSVLRIPPVPAHEALDPTGCGDAYRAGFLHGLARDMDWETSGRIASLMGSLKIGRHGTQNHRFTDGEFSEHFHEAFGYRFE